MLGFLNKQVSDPMATKFKGKTLQSLATQWDVSLSAVKSRASRGRVMLKQKLLDCCKIEVTKAGSVLDVEGRCETTPFKARIRPRSLPARHCR
jgi:RNA polymerase sigma-70 factor, ECF subfamily